MSNIIIRSATEADLPAISSLTMEWEQENITYGLVHDSVEDLALWRIWVAERAGRIIGFLAGHADCTEERTSIMPEHEPYFEVEELYVTKSERSAGAGDMLFRYAEAALKEEGFRHIMLTTATKDTQAMLRFYAQREGMQVWSMRSFKHL